MNRFIRTFIALIVILGLTLIARNNLAWAANPDQSSLAQAEQSVSPHGGDDDDDCKDKDKKKKHDDKDKDKCDDDDDDGTVKPPKDHEICDDKDASVGGIATVKVKKPPKDRCVKAHTREPDPKEDKLPQNAGAPLTDVVVLDSPGTVTDVQICFAAPPGKKVKIYGSGNHPFKAITTQVQNGLACAVVPSSGSYVLAGN